MAKILITGITGFIGRAVLKEILSLDHEISAIVRPQTKPSRYLEFQDKIKIKELNLDDTAGLRDFLSTSDFDTIMHIGALRGGRRASREEYYRSNVSSTEQMVDYCLKHDARLIYCSSVGVYGAIPQELPANYYSRKNPDNYYHFTKIEAEKIIGKATLHGLKSAIIRPSITYGKGDKGFPYQLVKLVAHYQFPLINKRVWIHLCHIDALVNAFKWCLETDYESGLVWNVADRDPVQLSALVNFISRQVHSRNYPAILVIDRAFFAMGESLSRLLKNELFISRFELISKSWFYDVQDYYQAMSAKGIKPIYTIPGMQITIDDYLGK